MNNKDVAQRIVKRIEEYLAEGGIYLTFSDSMYNVILDELNSEINKTHIDKSLEQLKTLAAIEKYYSQEKEQRDDLWYKD